MAWQTPKKDWDTNPKSPMSVDFNRIEGNIEFVKNEIEAKKGAIVNALNAVGISTNLSDTHSQISGKITGAEKMSVLITPSTSDIAIPKGIYNTNGGKVKGDANLLPENIVQGKSIFGISGLFKTYQVVEGTFIMPSNGTAYTVATGADFIPNLIIVYLYNDVIGTYINTPFTPYNASIRAFGDGGGMYNAFTNITNNSFRFTFPSGASYSGTTNYTWLAMKLN